MILRKRAILFLMLCGIGLLQGCTPDKPAKPQDITSEPSYPLYYD